MADETDKPIDRDGWRSLLAQGGGKPSELTDARIRAAARQAIPPRSARWWLPASLAASMLLAVLVVQWQYDRQAAPAIVSESAYAVPPAGPSAPRQSEDLLRDSAAPTIRDESTLVAAGRSESYLADTPTTAITGREVPQSAAEREGRLLEFTPPPAAPPPMIDLPAANESRAASTAAPEPAPADAAPAPSAPAPAAKREKDLGEIVVTGSRHRDDDREFTTPVTEVMSQGVTGGALGNLQKSSEAKRTPEEWYAEIEKLRAAGKKEVAERELEKLEAAHPGWLEEHLKQELPKE